ncbi:MAG: flagellar biosynthetic protein FliO [Thermoanaerobacteraceae bacterium]|nr:flagellar biosynthetic protein FliO [Thermoanaerobacteraceae bacterium]
MSELTAAVIRLLITLPLVLVLLYFFLKYGLGKKGFIPGGALKIVDQIPLGGKNFLVVVKVKEQYMLLGVSEKGIQLLERYDDYPERDSNVSRMFNHNMQRWLKAFLRGSVGQNEGDRDEK